jgi:hypothetical protein
MAWPDIGDEIEAVWRHAALTSQHKENGKVIRTFRSVGTYEDL